MNNIVLVNELAKIKAGSSGSSGSGSQFNRLTMKDQTWLRLSTLSTSFNAIGAHYYTRILNHGGGQFSIASETYSNGGQNQSQFYVIPFTVNQSTGAITVGSGASSYLNTSTGTHTTVTFASSGSYGFAYGQMPSSNGTSTQYGTCIAWNVSGNSISNITQYQNASNDYVGDNVMSPTSRSGSTAYFPVCYSYTGGTANNLVFSYNGSSISRQSYSNLSTNTSAAYTMPVATQFGQTLGSTSIGAVRFWNNSSGLAQIHTLDVSGGVTNTLNGASVFGPQSQGYFTGHGFELSNGKQIYYLSNGRIGLRDGTSMTDITDIADWAPLSQNYYNGVTPVATDKWIAVSDKNPFEMVKFSINPTTYRITNFGAFPLANLTLSSEDMSAYVGAHITGSNNQFVVSGNMYSEGASMQLLVGQHGLTGA